MTSSMFVIAANGNKLVIGDGTATPADTSKYSSAIFGGGYHQDIIGDTHVENHGSLLVTKIYGGGCGGDVTEDTYVELTGNAIALYGRGKKILIF